ncbi:Hemerythrin HHE cation binding domain protein [Desulfobulbus propionicus DSM 2032]|mgnify:CR=1 FL=1|jgi:hemerythrin-like domain-containing protein|uniref:Hemerythrin HHE cation binding domain protein n=1 Tax=Desulfobulbus propionicus (strain ATCC 33891 / DSM 2032 / VKM B-1956 / 1pr3) TaxID=577650 RepID=A0A7U3YLJ2_DESPD|nr:hemerythrin domain-containing protein [Desulfobulbus propionicus]ADW17609.1 Hemerythrin HHE cation binding domain protein [Desulfobulbus propionicus DSM 2032]
MQATDELRKEHHGIQLMLQVLGVLGRKLGANEPVEQAHLDRMMEFFTVFVDHCHHGKEEEYLFPALEAVGVPREGGPIGVMLNEHARGRVLVVGMQEALSALRAGDAAAKAAFASIAEEYQTLLLQHIDKENSVLFVLAADKLDGNKDAELFQAFERLEEERIGQGTHEQFHAFLEQMVRLYLR